MIDAHPESARHFDAARAGDYGKMSRIALAGYEACHELAACMLAASLGSGRTARILVVGAGGTAQEVVTAARLEPGWRFVGVDPSEPMLATARTRLEESGLSDRVELHRGTMKDLPGAERFDAAMFIGVLHHLRGDEAKASVLKLIADRLKPGAPLILAGNCGAYASQPLMLAAWGERWRMNGATPDEVQTKLAKVQEGTDPPASESAVFSLLESAGFGQPLRFFSSLFWEAWIARKM